MAATTSEESFASSGDSSAWTSVRGSPSSNGPPNTAHLNTLDVYDRSLVRLGRKIGEGGQGRIYEASLYLPYRFTPLSVVVKKFKPLQGVSQGHFPIEIASAKSYNLCIPHGIFFEGNSLCMIMRRYSCDLRSAIDSRMRVLRDEVDGTDATPFIEVGGELIIQQLAMGLKCLHELGVYHGDLKAANILVRTPGMKFDPSLSQSVTLGIADFERSEDFIGTGFFRAPEVLQSLRSRVPLSAEEWLLADVYSFGMVCYEILTGRYPFEGHLQSDYDLVLKGARPELPERIPERWRHLISRCWLADPHSRPTWDDIIKVVSQEEDYAVNHVTNMVSVEDLSFESLIREAKLLVRDLIAVYESDSQNFRADLIAYHWASEAVATAEAYASQFEVRAGSETPQTCGLQEYLERLNLYALMRHQRYGYAVMYASYSDLQDEEIYGVQDEEIYDVAMENSIRKERLYFITTTIVRKVCDEFVKLQHTFELEVGMSWTSKLVFFHDLAKYVLWCEHADLDLNRVFMMSRFIPPPWSLDVVLEAFLVVFCMMGNAYFYVLAMMLWEPLLLGLQYGLYKTKTKGFNGILYRSYGERICRFQRAWVNCTRHKVVPIILSASLVAFLGVCGWRGIFGWILIPCAIICSPYWREPIYKGA